MKHWKVVISDLRNMLTKDIAPKSLTRNIAPRLDKHITDSFYFALVVQTLLGMFSGMIFDGGVLGACFLCAFAGYWGFALIVCFRRPKSPTKWDIRFLRYGSLLLPLLTPMLYRLYWKLGYYGYL